MVTGRADGAPRHAEASRASNFGRSHSATMFGQGPSLQHLGVMSQEPRDGARDRFDDAVGRHQHDDGSGVVHDRSESVLTAAGQLEASALGQVAHAQQDHVLAQPLCRGADHFDEAPPRSRMDPDLNGHAHLFAPDSGKRTQGQLTVVGVDEVETGLAPPVVQPALEHPLGRAVRPDDVPASVDDDDRVREVLEGVGHGTSLVRRRTGALVRPPPCAAPRRSQGFGDPTCPAPRPLNHLVGLPSPHTQSLCRLVGCPTRLPSGCGSSHHLCIWCRSVRSSVSADALPTLTLGELTAPGTLATGSGLAPIPGV